MKNKVLGIYEFGFYKFKIYLDDGCSGSFDVAPSEENIPFIKIGLNRKKWHHALDLLLHESMEAVMTLMRLRYYPDYDLSNSADQYVFHFNHPEFCNVSAYVAEGLASAAPDLYKEYKLFQKNKKKKGKKK